MALTYSTTDQFGNTYSAAYLKVLTVGIAAGANGTRIVVGVYKDATARAKGGTPKTVILQENLNCRGSDNQTYFADSVLDNDGVSPLKQAYAWLKTQSDPIDLRSASDA
jgi:hypothetical protein